MRITFLAILFLLSTLTGTAQEYFEDNTTPDKAEAIIITPEMKKAEIDYNEKIVELYNLSTGKGFVLQKETRIHAESKKESQVRMQLNKGEWYHFVFVGDPLSDKIKVKLFLDGAGTMIEDILRASQTNEFWTEFSFICPATGIYEFSTQQNSSISRPLSYLMLFAKK